MSPFNYTPHFIMDRSDDLSTPVWSPTPRLEQLLTRLHLRPTAVPPTPPHNDGLASDEPLELEDNDYSPVDHDDTHEMRVHIADDPIPRPRWSPLSPSDREGDDEYEGEEFEDEVFDAIIDQAGLPGTSAMGMGVATSPPPLIFQHLDGLTSIGYPDHCARFALARCGGNLHDALEFLLSGEITLYEEYRQVAAAHAAFQRLLERLEMIGSAAAGARTSGTSRLEESSTASPLVSRHFPTATVSERRLLMLGIQHACAQQMVSSVADLAVYDWLDARDMYGQWFLAQVLQRRSDPPAFIVHFFGWDDAYNERVVVPSDRVRLPSLFDATSRRLEDERQHRRCKVYGPALHQFIKAEREKSADYHPDRHHQLASVHMHDPYSFPPLHSQPTMRSKDFYTVDPSSPHLVGSLVHLTTECIEALHRSLGLGTVDLDHEYAVGNRLMVYDTVGKLCEAEIIEVRGCDIRIHYPGWGGRWDENLPTTSPRIYNKKGSNRRRPRLHQWKGVGGVTAQLFSLVGRVGVVTAKGRASDGGGEKGEGKTTDLRVQVEAFDEDVGSAFTFWTRLSLLKRVDLGDAPQLSLSAILEMQRDPLIHTATLAEQSRLAKQAGSLLESLTVNIPATRPASAATSIGSLSPSEHPASSLSTLPAAEELSRLLICLPVYGQVRSSTIQSSFNGWVSDVYGGVGESLVCVPPHHLQPVDIDLPSSASSLATSTSSIEAELGVVEKRRQWWDERRYRGVQSQDKAEKVAVLSSLARLFFATPPFASSETTLPYLNPSSLSTLRALLSKVTSALLSPIAEEKVNEEDAADVTVGSVSLTSLLSDVGMCELKQGNRVRLHLSSPAVDALMVTWVRTSQPNFEVTFFQCADSEVHYLSNEETSTAAPSSLPVSTRPSAPTARSVPHSDSEESIQLQVTERAGPLTSLPSIASSGGSSSAPSDWSSVSRSVATFPPQLSLLKALPPLKVAGIPLVVSNACYMQIGGAKRGKEDMADVVEDELHLVITPVHDGVTEAAAAAIELLLHIKREWRAQTSRQADGPLRNGEGSTLSGLRETFAELSAMTRAALDSLTGHFIALNAACPWPSVPKVRLLELLSHLLLEVKEDLQPNDSLDALLGTLPPQSQAPPSLSWLKSLASEARLRYAQEKEGWPLYSSYFHRLLELLTIAALLDMQRHIPPRPPPLYLDHLLQQVERAKELEEQCSPSTSSTAREDVDRSDASVSLTVYCQRHFHLPLRLISGVVVHFPHLVGQHQHPADCLCPHCFCERGNDPHTSEAVLLMDFHSPFWPLLLGGASPLLLPSVFRYHLFDELINATTSIERTQPEFFFSTAKDRALESTSSASSTSGVGSVLQQLFSQLSVTSPHHFRIKLGDIPFKAQFKGAFHRGAQGTPGPFRQSLTDACADLRRSSPSSLLIPCPNFVHDTGLNRNTLLLNPSSLVPLKDAVCLGQLMGIAMRSGGVLDIDLAAVVWKQLLELDMGASDLADVDFTAWRTLQWQDPSDPTQPMGEAEWNDLYGFNLTWTTLASDQLTQLHLRPFSTPTRYVRYEERLEYARAVVQARLNESRHLIDAIKGGLYSIVPRAALAVLTWRELQHRVCGESELELGVLARHTVYAPKKFTEDSPIVQWLWRVLQGFTSEEKGKFLQFCLARSRLPPVTSREGSWRMKVNILEAASVSDLPSAETCFFNLNVPNYPNEAALRTKLLLAITHCSSINS